jgi:hypothetical protein
MGRVSAAALCLRTRPPPPCTPERRPRNTLSSRAISSTLACACRPFGLGCHGKRGEFAGGGSRPRRRRVLALVAVRRFRTPLGLWAEPRSARARACCCAMLTVDKYHLLTVDIGSLLQRVDPDVCFCRVPAKNNQRWPTCQVYIERKGHEWKKYNLEGSGSQTLGGGTHLSL